MAAPKGNKHGVGHGRPPNEGYSNEELIVLGEELIKWLKDQDKPKDKEDKEEKQRIVHLSQWYSEIKNISRTQWESIAKRDSFRGYYEKAMQWMGKRIMLDTKLPTAYGSRFLGIYFKEIAEREWELKKKEIDYELERRAALEAKKNVPPNDKDIANLHVQIKEAKIDPIPETNSSDSASNS